MAKTLQHRRDTTANLASVCGSIGELFMDTTKNTLVVMDGATTGGHPLATELDLAGLQGQIPIQIGDLSDVQAGVPANQQILMWHAGFGEFRHTSVATLNGQDIIDTNANFCLGATNLSGLSDVSTCYNSNGQALIYNSGVCKFLNTTLSLNSLSNVATCYNSNGQALTYDSGTCKFVNTSLSLNSLSNVATCNNQNGQVLTYDSGTCKFVNAYPAGGGGGGATCLNGLSDVCNNIPVATSGANCILLGSYVAGNTTFYTSDPYCMKNAGSVSLSRLGSYIGNNSLINFKVTPYALKSSNVSSWGNASLRYPFYNCLSCNSNNFISTEHFDGTFWCHNSCSFDPVYNRFNMSHSVHIGHNVFGGYDKNYDDAPFKCVFSSHNVVLGTNNGVNANMIADYQGYQNLTFGNVLIGTNALGHPNLAMPSLTNNVVLGSGAGWCTQTECSFTGTCYPIKNNVLIGPSAGTNSRLQTWNGTIAIGECAFGNRAGGYCQFRGMPAIAIGHNALATRELGNYYHTAGYSPAFGNIAIGDRALSNTNVGDDNIAIGRRALNGYMNYAFCAGYNCHNVAMGLDAGAYADQHKDNVFIGFKSGNSLGSRSQCRNVMIGSHSGGYYANSGRSFGNCNTFVGAHTGTNSGVHGSNVTLLGFNATPSSYAASDEITFGNNSIYTIRANVQTITALSDARDKESIESVPYGLNFLKKIRPVSFTWNTRDGAKKGGKELGFIAQELDEAMESSQLKEWLSGLVLKTNPDRLEASEGKLLPLIVKAIQELDQRITNLENN